MRRGRRVMMARKPAQNNQVLVKGKKYVGKYVAMVSFNKKAVVASGKDPIDVRNRAERKGVDCPVIMYVPPKDAFNVF